MTTNSRSVGLTVHLKLVMYSHRALNMVLMESRRASMKQWQILRHTIPRYSKVFETS